MYTYVYVFAYVNIANLVKLPRCVDNLKIYMYVRGYVHVYTYFYAYMYTDIYEYTKICKSIYVQIWVYMCIYIHARIYIFIYVNIYITYVYTYMHLYIYAYIYTYICQRMYLSYRFFSFAREHRDLSRQRRALLIEYGPFLTRCMALLRNFGLASRVLRTEDCYRDASYVRNRAFLKRT